MFTVTVFEILLFEGRSVLSSAQRGTGSERFKIIWTDVTLGVPLLKVNKTFTFPSHAVIKN